MSDSIQKNPAVVIRWDDAHKAVAVQMDPSQVRNPDFALAVLDMARRAVEAQLKQMQFAAMQQAEAQKVQVAGVGTLNGLGVRH